MTTISYRQGFSTIELLIAFAVATLFLSGIVLLAFGGQTATLDAGLQNGGLYRISTLIRDSVASTTQNWSVTLPTQTTNFYTQGAATTDISPCIKYIAASSTWTSEKGRGQTLSLGTFIASPAEAKKIGGGCDPFPPGDWDNPANPGWTVTPNDQAGLGTSVAVTTSGSNKYAFIITTNSGNLNKPDLWPINVTTPSSPTVTGMNPLALQNTTGLDGIVIVGHYAYVLNDANTNQLEVVDISDPSNPSYVTVVAIPPAKINYTCQNNTTCLNGKSIAYYNGYIYIGTNYLSNLNGVSSTQNNEFHAFCINNLAVTGCGPRTPVWSGEYNVDHNVNAIAFKGKYAYLATSDDTSELTILDISNPASIQPAGSCTNCNTNTSSNDLNATSIAILGNYLVLGLQSAGTGNGSKKDLFVFDIGTNPTNPSQSKTKKLGLQNNAAVLDIVLSRNIAFLITSDPNGPFQVWDYLSNPNSIVAVSTCNNILNIANAVSETLMDGLLYAVNSNQAALYILHDKEGAQCIP